MTDARTDADRTDADHSDAGASGTKRPRADHPGTPHPDHLHTTRAFYDAIAEEYTELFRNWLDAKPLDRALLAGYAELAGADGEVADAGCGPGRGTAYLASLGLNVFGLDLSEAMLTVARREHPRLRFVHGDLLRMDVADGTLAGVVSLYSTIHLPDEELPAAFAEFFRVLAPGGHVLVAFQVGDEPRRHDRPFGRPVSLDFRRRRPDRMAGLLEAAGFGIVLRSVHAPDEQLEEPTPQAYLIARKPR
ncbi:class I SAM-dependent methyltransferase [Streptomyces sp. SBST2-5]|uniref:Class I SAM-dependent methyltransferase n=1 Tax=Streptomyces composti TaxID=2720025 RepID=A0ABX1A142_9ACTN|nr:class I SAM-dependent methyltransferase [Streptomyces composti]NJP49146.1 class I SAM-dependent methyltransferase [Streptomyces composti]